MKKLTGTVKLGAPVPAPSFIPPPITKVVTKISVSPIDALTSIKKKDGSPLVSYNEAINLTGLKFKRGDLILSMSYRYFIYEVINMLNRLDYEIVYNFLNAGWETAFGQGAGLRKKILFENPLLDSSKERFQLNMEIYRNKVDVSKGVSDCKRCGSDETLTVERQIRGSDEPMTLFSSCLQCGHRWKG